MKIFMFIDDSPVIHKVAERILTDMGFIFVGAEDGADALEKARYNMPDVVLVDWDMPKLNGLEFIEEFIKLEGADHSHMLYCTSEIMVPEMARAKRMGCSGFLMKPFNREIVAAKLQEIGIEVNNSEQAA